MTLRVRVRVSLCRHGFVTSAVLVYQTVLLLPIIVIGISKKTSHLEVRGSTLWHEY